MSQPEWTIARRAFAEEFNNATHSFQEREGERAPVYVLLPTGQRANRVFVVGTLTEVDVYEDDDWIRGRVTDPTGAFEIDAGQFQPVAVKRTLRELEVPAYVSVIGKARRYETSGGQQGVKIRAETLNETTEATRERWVWDTARLTTARLAGFDPASDQYARMVESHYAPDLPRYRNMVLEALAEVQTVTPSA